MIWYNIWYDMISCILAVRTIRSKREWVREIREEKEVRESLHMILYLYEKTRKLCFILNHKDFFTSSLLFSICHFTLLHTNKLIDINQISILILILIIILILWEQKRTGFLVMMNNDYDEESRWYCYNICICLWYDVILYTKQMRFDRFFNKKNRSNFHNHHKSLFTLFIIISSIIIMDKERKSSSEVGKGKENKRKEGERFEYQIKGWGRVLNWRNMNIKRQYLIIIFPSPLISISIFIFLSFWIFSLFSYCFLFFSSFPSLVISEMSAKEMRKKRKKKSSLETKRKEI